MTQTIGFLGIGRIAEPMVRALSRTRPDAQILISQRSQSISRKLEPFPNVTVAGNESVVADSDVLFLCLLADTAREVLGAYTYSREQKVISVMADISLREIDELTAPASNACVTIPLPFVDAGRCPLPVYPRSPVLEELFGEENPVIPLQSERDIEAHFAASAILLSTMKHLETAAQWLAGECGNAADAERYITALVGGYLASLPGDGQGRLTEVMQGLSTEGGLNSQLRDDIESSGYYQTLTEGLGRLLVRLRN